MTLLTTPNKFESQPTFALQYPYMFAYAHPYAYVYLILIHLHVYSNLSSV